MDLWRLLCWGFEFLCYLQEADFDPFADVELMRPNETSCVPEALNNFEFDEAASAVNSEWIRLSSCGKLN